MNEVQDVIFFLHNAFKRWEVADHRRQSFAGELLTTGEGRISCISEERANKIKDEAERLGFVIEFCRVGGFPNSRNSQIYVDVIVRLNMLNEISTCDECGCKLARKLSELEFHRNGCSNIPY